MNKNIKDLLEYIVNEENIQLTNKLNNNDDFLNNIINYFKKNFNPKIIIDIKIENVNIQKNEFYEYLKDEELIASTFADVNNKINSLYAEIAELKEQLNSSTK